MDIAAISTSLTTGKIMNQVGVSLAKMGMDLVEQQGQAITQLMESASLAGSINPHIGSNIDIKL